MKPAGQWRCQSSAHLPQVHNVAAVCHPTCRKPCLLQISKERVLAIAQQTARKTPKQQLREFDLASRSQAQKDAFVEEARQEDILGSCARPWDYTVCGFRSYLKFAGQLLPLGASLLPPKLRILLAWQRTSDHMAPIAIILAMSKQRVWCEGSPQR